MGMFETVKFVPILSTEIPAISKETAEYFRAKGFEVKEEQTITGGSNISLSKGSMFKSVLGMKTALNIEIEPVSNGTRIKAGIGIFGQQVIPSVITVFIAWPVMIAQIWGMVQQSKLDDELVRFIEELLYRHSSYSNGTYTASRTAGTAIFCTECGTKLEQSMKFCSECGTKH